MKKSLELVEDIVNYKPQKGEAAFWWIGQLGYIVKTASATFSFDAYLDPNRRRTVEPLLSPHEMTFVDFVFGSHDHSDHIVHYAWPGIAEAAPAARFVAPEMFVGKLGEKFKIAKSRFIGLDEGKTFSDGDIPGFRILAIASAHEFLAPDPATGLHDSLGYIVDADGVRIYHSGDTCKYEGLETKLIQNSPIDLMFLPINGRDAVRYTSHCIGNMSFAEAVDLAGAVAPGLAVPGHYEMFTSNSEDPSKFTDYLAAKYPGQKTWVGAHGTRVIYPGTF
jgi:L-ascorbate metabolism protein UlaG (beta-lactamase superfamily)